MNNLTHLATTLDLELAPIGGNDHPIPVAVSMECENGSCYWVVCISIRNAKTEFTSEAEHADLDSAIKNALRGIRAKVNTLDRNHPEVNQIIRSNGGDRPATWDTERHKNLGYFLTGEYHSNDYIREEPGDVGLNPLAIVDHDRGN